MFAERCQEVRVKVAALIVQYENRTGQKVPHVDIRFDLRGRAAGQASARGWNYSMRFNRDMMMNEAWDHLINDTVPHELAHIICFANGSDRGHGYNWRRTCQALGGSGERCHSEAVTYAKGRTFVYTTSTGQTYNVSEVKHRRIQQGAGYSFRDRKMGRIDRTCAYSLLGSTMVVTPTVSPKAVPVASLLPKPAVPAQGSKADMVRHWMRLGLTDAEIIQQAEAMFGMKAALVKTYIKNNRSKV